MLAFLRKRSQSTVENISKNSRAAYPLHLTNAAIMKGFIRGTLFTAISGITAVGLLYVALFLYPGMADHHTLTVPHISPKTRPQEASEIDIRATKFTPNVLLSAPRRSVAIPNANGSLALYTVSKYSFESHKKRKETRVLDLRSGQSTLITDDGKRREPHWLENSILWLKGGSDGSTQLVVGNMEDNAESYIAGTILGSVSHYKLKVLENGKVAILFSAKTMPNGSLYNPDYSSKKHSTGLLYDSLMVRHWDTYVTPNKNSLWYAVLQLSDPRNSQPSGRYTLSPAINALKDTNLESPIPPFDSSEHFDISHHGIAFVAKDPKLSPATNTKCNLYYLAISSFSSTALFGPKKVEVRGFEGACASPVFSPRGQAIAYLQMKKNGYESDKNHVIIVPDISDPSTATELLKSGDEKGSWDRSPSGFIWSNSGEELYLLAEDQGNGLLWKMRIASDPTKVNEVPEKLTTSGSVKAVQALSSNSTYLFLSGDSLIDNSLYSIVDPFSPHSLKEISSNSHKGNAFGLAPSQISSIWFQGAHSTNKVHAWVVKPSNFNSSRTYPLAYLIHGGPQGAWTDSWSTRWNPAVFAEQGYVVVTPNPTGSTSYGQNFTDAIYNDWGGAPYKDLVAGFQYIEENLHFIDTSRSVALGASYGGFMMNWIQGHSFGRKFKALVTHDGVFSMVNQMSSDEQYFPNHDLGGPIWTSQSNWDQWDPARHLAKWATPHLIIHNGLDYRLPISEGLAAFNVLQQKGVDSRFLTFPDENHWVLKEENSLVWHTVVLNWINKYVGLEPYRPESMDDFEMLNRVKASS